MAADQRPPYEQKRVAGAGRLVALIGASAAAILSPLVVQWEGTKNDPYYDIAGILTVCTGETHGVVKGRHYSDAECSAMLQNRLADFAAPVLHCTPSLRQHPEALAAAISLTYNIGPAAYCTSSAARYFRAGDVRRGCDNFLSWNKARVNGRLVPVQGLTNRRNAERSICLKSVAA